MCQKKITLMHWFQQVARRTAKLVKNSKKYIPSKPIRLLIVSESPLLNGSYFYKPKANCHNNSLPAKIFKSLYLGCSYKTIHEYSNCLLKFMDDGYYLIELVEFPIDNFSCKLRSDFILANFDSFCKRLRTLKFSSNCIFALSFRIMS